MNKTKLGVSTGMLAAIVFLLAISVEFVNDSFFFGVGLILVVAYILCKEEDLWLKASAVKAVVIVLIFSLVPFLFGFAYDIIYSLDFVLQFANTHIRDEFKIIEFCICIIKDVEKVLLLILAILAFKGKTIKIPVIDNMIAKHIQ